MIQLENAVKHFRKIILDTMKDENIKCWIAGGAVRNYFMSVNEKTDYDLFFPNIVHYNKAKAFFSTLESEIVFENENGMKVIYKDHQFDLIKHFFATPEATINMFDFTVSMFAVDYEKVYHGETSFMDLAKRQLMLNAIPFPASTLKRSYRYYNKGFKMCVGEMKKLVKAIQSMEFVEEKEQKQEEPKNPNEEEVTSGEGWDDFFVGID